jgi:adenine-specific DNA-methyltransferase
MAKKSTLGDVAAIVHEDATRRNIPTAEYQAMLRDRTKQTVPVAYERRNRDLDPQLVWRGKDEQDWSDLVVHAPPLYIQEKVHPKVLVDDLLRETRERRQEPPADENIDLFADFNGIPEGADRRGPRWSARRCPCAGAWPAGRRAPRRGSRGWRHRCRCRRRSHRW